MRRWLARSLRWFASAVSGDADARPGRTGRSEAARKSEEDEGLEQRLSLNNFARRLEQSLKHKASSTGNLQLIRLDSVRDQVGDRWEEIRERAFMIAENVIRARIGIRDAYVRYGDTAFMVLFTELGEQAAAVKAMAIRQDIERRLIGGGGQESPEFAVQSRVLPVTSLVEPEGAAALSDFGISLDGKKSSQDARFLEEDRTSGGPGEAPLPRDPEEILGSVQIGYRPTWNRKRGLISLYQANPMRIDSRGKTYRGEAVFPRGGEGHVTLNFDKAVARIVVHDLRRMTEEGSIALVSASLHFGSLASRDREEVLGPLRLLSEAERRRLIIEMLGIPHGTPSGRLAETFAIIAPYCRAATVRLPLGEQNFGRYVGMSVHAVGVDLRDPGNRRLGGDERDDALTDFILRGSTFGFETFVWGADDESTVTIADQVGVDYLNGNAVAADVERPGSYYPWTPGTAAGTPEGAAG